MTAKLNGLAMSATEDSLEKRVAEEVAMRTFDYKLALAIGGQAYSDLFRAGVYCVKKVHERSGLKQPPQFTGKGVALDLCFGPPLTERGKRFRDQLFHLFCELANADRNMKERQATRWKCHLVRSGLTNFRS